MKITVIGGGPGGYVAAIRAAQLGADVVLVEKEHLGGTCLNKGCIPTKALLASAHAMHTAAHSESFGVKASAVLDWKTVQKNRQETVEKLVSGVEGLLRANKVKVLRGTAEFASQKSIIVRDASGKAAETVEADRFIIATGSEPAVPPIAGIEKGLHADSTEALKFDERPASLIVIGGGVIGTELAAAYNEFGTNVTVVELADTILPGMDADAVRTVTGRLTSDGVDILAGSRVEEIGEDTKGKFCTVTDKTGNKKTVYAEKILVCVGRKPDFTKLSLEKAGIEYGTFIRVNDNLQTTNKNIYAIGDANGLLMLAGAASEQGIIAAENCFEKNTSYDKANSPRMAFVTPEIAEVGASEKELSERREDFGTGFFPAVGNGRSVVEHETSGFVKIFFGKKYGEILGAVIVGPQANELISTITLAIKAEATITELTDMSFGHPILGECLHEAALAADGRAIHMPNKRK